MSCAKDILRTNTDEHICILYIDLNGIGKRLLDQLFVGTNGIYEWNIDLSDWQHILRVETVLSKNEVKNILRITGIKCAENAFLKI